MIIYKCDRCEKTSNERAFLFPEGYFKFTALQWSARSAEHLHHFLMSLELSYCANCAKEIGNKFAEIINEKKE